MAHALGGAAASAILRNSDLGTDAVRQAHIVERAAEAQRLAMSTGRTLEREPPELARKTYEKMREGDRESARLHLESIKRIITRGAPEFAC